MTKMKNVFAKAKGTAKSKANKNARTARSSSNKPPASVSMMPAKSIPLKGEVPNRNMIPHSRVEKICSLSDPFCDHARGAPWPDGNGFAAGPYAIRNHVQVSSLSNGGALTYITPINVPACTLLAGTWTGTQYTTDATYTSIPGYNFSTYFTTYRVVTAGIVIRNLSSVMNTQGYLIISRLTAPPTFSTNVAPGVVINPQVLTYPIVPGMEIPVLHRPIGADSRNFVVFSSASTQIVDPHWDIIKIEVVGAAASAVCIDIEIYYNYEMQLTANSPLAPLLNKVGTADPALMQASSAVSSELAKTAVDSLKSLSLMAGKKALAWATKGVSNLLIGD